MKMYFVWKDCVIFFLHDMDLIKLCMPCVPNTSNYWWIFWRGDATYRVFVCNSEKIGYILVHSFPNKFRSEKWKKKIWFLFHLFSVNVVCFRLHCRRKWVWMFSPYFVSRQINNNNNNKLIWPTYRHITYLPDDTNMHESPHNE